MNDSKMEESILVIGAGPGGYAAAFHAADLGMNVTLVDPEANPGGVCLYRGCIPSKALLHVAGFLHEAEMAAEWGVSVGKPDVDLDRLREWKQSVVKGLTGGLGQLTKQRKIAYVRGTAAFEDATHVTVETEGGETQSLSFDHAIVASGSKPSVIPGLPESERIMSSREALDLPDIPERLLVVGGGYIGLELGQVYASLGARVSVVEMLPEILPGADRDLVRPLAQRLKTQFETIMTGTKVSAMAEEKKGIRVTFEGGDAAEVVYDRILVAVGRKPYTEGLGLENTKAEVTDAGFIAVDMQRRTAEPTIFAIGDVAGQPMLAHKASHEARVAVEAAAGKKTAFDPKAIPAVVFSDPEIAWAGLTQAQAEKDGIETKVVTFPWAASGRATTLSRKDGLTKLLLDPSDGRVLGVGLVGHGAGELLAEGALAIEMGAVAEDLALTIHAHPTLSETMMEAAEAFVGFSTHFYRKR